MNILKILKKNKKINKKIKIFYNKNKKIAEIKNLENNLKLVKIKMNLKINNNQNLKIHKINQIKKINIYFKLNKSSKNKIYKIKINFNKKLKKNKMHNISNKKSITFCQKILKMLIQLMMNYYQVNFKIPILMRRIKYYLLIKYNNNFFYYIIFLGI